jgi:hypothetical protein
MKYLLECADLFVALVVKIGVMVAVVWVVWYCLDANKNRANQEIKAAYNYDNMKVRALDTGPLKMEGEK